MCVNECISQMKIRLPIVLSRWGVLAYCHEVGPKVWPSGTVFNGTKLKSFVLRYTVLPHQFSC